MKIDIDEQTFLTLIKALIKEGKTDEEIVTKYEDAALAFNSALVSSVFIRIKGCEFKKHEKIIIDSNNPKYCAEVIDVEGIDVKKIKAVVLGSTDADAIFNCAITLYNAGECIDSFDKRLIELRNPTVSYEFCKYVKNASISEHEEIVKSSGKTKLCADFVTNVKQGSNVEGLLDAIMASGEYEYLVDIACNDKLLDIENIRRHILLKIIKNKNPLACYLYAIRVKDANKVLLLNVALIDEDPRYANIKEKCKEELSDKELDREELDQMIREYRKSLRNPVKPIRHGNYFSFE